MNSLDYPEAGFGTVELSFSYANQDVLREVDFHVMPGEVHALVGKQNEGKSTLCAVLAGALRPASGWILAGGRPFRFLTPDLARNFGIEWIGKEARVFPDLTVAENIFMGDDGPWWRRFALWGNGFRKVRKWLEESGVELSYDRPIRDLLKEDRLFVELMGRLRRRPRLLILDETLEQLTDRRIRDFKRVTGPLLRQGMAILRITHKIEEALETSQRITVLRRGRVLFTSHAADVDRFSLVRVCFSELGKEDGEDVTREQFYELIRFIEAMLRDLPAMVVIADLERRIRLLNHSARAAFGGGEDWLGRTLEEFLGRMNPRVGVEVGAAVRNREDREWHGVAVGPGTAGMLVDVRVRGVQERGGRIGHMLIIEDVSVREEMRRRLALSDNLASVGLLAAGVAHEVNDPLAIINNYLGFIRHEVEDADVGRAVRLAQDEIDRIQQIIDNLVAFSGSDAPPAEAVDIMALAEELCNLLRFHSNARRVRFVCKGPGFPLWIRANANEMRQVLLNLLRNALDAIEGDGRIDIDGDLAAAGGRVVLTVSDNGQGIQLDNPEEIFRPFVTTKKGRGTHQGLGLSIVYGIMEKHGGRIQAHHRDGGGCRMVLSFPAADFEYPLPPLPTCPRR